MAQRQQLGRRLHDRGWSSRTRPPRRGSPGCSWDANTRPRALRSSWRWRPTGNCTTLERSWAGGSGWQNRLTGQAPLIGGGDERHRDHGPTARTTSLGREGHKQNVQGRGPGGAPGHLRQGRAEALRPGGRGPKGPGWGFSSAQDLQHGGVTGKTMWGGEELLTLDYGKLTAVLWGVCKRLQVAGGGAGESRDLRQRPETQERWLRRRRWTCCGGWPATSM